MNNTHIIIPIKKIEGRIQTLKNAIAIEKKNRKEGWEEVCDELGQVIDLYKGIVASSKHVAIGITNKSRLTKLCKELIKSTDPEGGNDKLYQFFYGEGYNQAHKELT